MKLICINRIKVQNANAVAGLTTGSVSPTAVMGATHTLQRKIDQHYSQEPIKLLGTAMIVHEHHQHTFKNDNGAIKFTQSRNAPYLHGLTDDKKSSPASVIEEGKMNVTLSLLIAYDGFVADNKQLEAWLDTHCRLLRIAGGSILDIKDISLVNITGSDKAGTQIKRLVRSLLPGFVLYDRNDLLASHANEQDIDTLPAWIDFVSLKQVARPEHKLIDKHLSGLTDNKLWTVWQKYLTTPYLITDIPDAITQHFDTLNDKSFKALLKQWQSYLNPDNKTPAQWEYQPKPASGYLVPIITGYKAISPVYKNDEVDNTRDATTDVCFVEAVHTVGEWQSVHRIKELEQLEQALWCYDYQPNWYLCKQNYQPPTINNNDDEDYI
ncbi:type I-F CRISPR-associated protein Csy2 [Psychrobacter raelei]|uniref:type I-F CRISPR-associated protein Csy2 n=1 Tax=Psychrobacter raelei TaxID=2565531 RepID=UPI003F5E1EA9